MAEVPQAFSPYCLRPATFCDSVSLMDSSNPAVVPFVSSQEGGKRGGTATTTGCREGRAPALLCSMVRYPPECALAAVGGGVTITTAVILAQEGILLVCASVRDEREKRREREREREGEREK
uniref:Uncharacterized protein n=1 Tax=Micrurus lemniscatus lemniscatus TaxID=129467 RepID=A0A2D4JP74_MICLE